MAQPSAGSTPERPAFALPGIVGLLIVVLLGAGAIGCILGGVAGAPGLVILGVLLGIAAFLCMGGLFVIQPNQAEVLVFLGRYRGTVRKDGWYWTNPFTAKRKLSLRVQNFNTPTLPLRMHN